MRTSTRPSSGHAWATSACCALTAASTAGPASGKTKQKLVAAAVDLGPAGSRDLLAHQPAVILEHRGIALAQPPEQLGRALDVGVEEA